MDEFIVVFFLWEIQCLFEFILCLCDEGMVIIYISYCMVEVYEFFDWVSVLCDGQYVGSLVCDKFNVLELVCMMVGWLFSDFFNKEWDIFCGQLCLWVEDLIDGGKIKFSSLVVYVGEIVGFVGLVGVGCFELVQLIFGVCKVIVGVIEIDGELVVIYLLWEVIDFGIGFLIENCKEQGLFFELVVQENIIMVMLECDVIWGMFNCWKV